MRALLRGFLVVCLALYAAEARKAIGGEEGPLEARGRALQQLGFFGGGGGLANFFGYGNSRQEEEASTPPSPSPTPSPSPQQQQQQQQQEQQQSTQQQQQQQQQQPSVQLIEPPPPPSVQLTGPRFTPAPAVYNTSPLPTYASVGQKQGPVNANSLASAAPPGQCKTLGEVLAAIPEASQWLTFLKSAGIESVLLTDPTVQSTLLVPINSAFTAEIDAAPLRTEKSFVDLIRNAPDIINPLAGYSVLKGLWPSATLRSGASLPTSNTIDKVNPLTIKVAGPTQLQGLGNSANILQADIAACGPSVVHIIDQILLPFAFDQGPTDAILGTQVGSSRPAYSSAG